MPPPPRPLKKGKAPTAATPEQRMASFDKQIVRDWLAANWDQAAFEAPPRLPQEIVEQTAERYRTLLDRLTLGR